MRQGSLLPGKADEHDESCAEHLTRINGALPGRYYDESGGMTRFGRQIARALREPGMQSREVDIGGDYVVLKGTLMVPEDAAGVVAFVHGSGSSRLSPRNRDVAGVLQQARLATLLFDLLTVEEYRHDVFSAEYRFNVPLLTRRLKVAIDWLRREPATAALPLGLFGASTGAAAALSAAAQQPGKVRAIVSRGGRPDLARDALSAVAAPTLLIVGEFDGEVIRLNESAAAQLRCERRIEIVPGATHLFEEPGTLEKVAALAAHWFASHLGPEGG